MQTTSSKHYNSIVTQLVGKESRPEKTPTIRDGFQVFVSIPQQGRSLTLKLKGNESEGDLCEKVRTLTGLELLNDSMNLTSQGLRLSSSSQLIANATITVSATMLGGSEIYATLKEEPQVGGDANDVNLITRTIDDEDITFGAAIQLFNYQMDEKKNDYLFTYEIGNPSQEFVAPAPDDTQQESVDLLAKTLTKLGHVAGETIKVKVKITSKDSAKEDPHLQFLSTIPYCKPVRKSVGQILDKGQQERMGHYITKQMAPEDLNKILNVMTDYQMDNLLLDFCDMQTHKEAMLEYLLRRSGQWNLTSKSANKKASEHTKSEQMRRIIQSFDNRWVENDDNDKVVSQIFQLEQEKVLDRIFENLESVQRTELFMLWLTPKQRCQCITLIQPSDVRQFWQLLKQDRRMEIFNGVEKSVQFQFAMTDIYLEPLQKKKIWDNFSIKNKTDMWKSCEDPAVIKDFWKNDFEVELAAPATGSLMANQFALQILNPLKQFEKKADSKKVKILQRKLLNQLTINQRAAFWAIQDEQRQIEILEHISNPENSATENEDCEFWSILNHSKRCQMIAQLPYEGLEKLFVAMNLEDKAQLIEMVNEDIRTALKKQLLEDDIKDLFLYSHFEQTDRTELGSEQFINALVDDFYSENNQVVPFDKIEDGYVQCIRDSRRNDHFFTVQIIEPQYVVENHDMPYVEDETKRAYFTDEAIEFDLAKKERNDTFRFVQNYYGELKETDPDQSRNVGKTQNVAIISSQLVSTQKGIWNEHSFFAENPVVFAHSHHTNPALTADEDILFTGSNQDIFFFNYVDATVEMSKDCKQRHKKLDLCLQILNKNLDANQGEASRLTSENCQTIRIDPKSYLFDYIKNGSFEMNKFAEVFILNTVPTIIEGRDDKFVVFSHCQKSKDGNIEHGEGQGPTLYFFSVKHNREVFQVKGGEAFIDWYPTKMKGGRPVDNKGKLTILANKELMMSNIWSDETKIQRTDAGKYFKAAENERKNAIVIGLNLDLEVQLDADIKNLLSVEDGRIMECNLQSNIEDEANSIVAKINPTKDSFYSSETVTFVATIDMIDEDKVFAQRYLRKTPVQFFVHDRNEKTHEIQSFTILFKELQSFSFSFIQVEGRLNATQQKECQAGFDYLSNEIQGLVVELEGMGDTSSMKANVLEQHRLKQQEIEEKKKQKEEVFTSKIPKYDQFKCKYFVPNASCLFIQKGQKKTYVQVTNGSERAQLTAKDNLRDVNTFDIQLFSITQLNVKSDTTESIPTKDNTSVKAPMSRQALTAYANNSAPMNKFGAVDIKATCCPLMQTKDGQVGAFIYQHQDKNVKSQRVEWFRGRVAGKDLQQMLQQKQTVSVDYPLMVYKGYMPDNREIVLVNLADKENPQKILHLYDMQFICFVGHNFSERDSKIGMICVENDKFILCWLVSKQPFKKREINELDHYELHKYPIEFNVPIMNNIGGLIRVEFVKAANSSIDDTSCGALLVQTTEDLYFSSNLTGHFQSITNGNMANVTFQKGYNSTFYYCQIANDTDCIVNELQLQIVNGEWIFNAYEVMKTNEAMIIALEMDPENREKTDSIYRYDRSLIEQQEHVLNILYIVDDTENMWKMRQRGPEESGGRYEELKEINLSLGKSLTQEFTQYKKKGFNQMAITDRCISLNSINFNFYNGHSWPLDLTRSQDKHNKFNDQENSEDEDENEKTDQQESTGDSQVHSIENISWTSRQLITCSYQDLVKNQIQTTESDDLESNETQDKITKKYKSTHAFVTKLHPGTRRQDLIGLRGLRDLESLNDISNELFLIKFRGADMHGLTDYWSIIDKFGQIQRIPSKIQKSLTWCNFSSGQSRQREDGTTLVLRGGQKKVLSFEADVAYNEKKITQIDFNRRGEVYQVKQFRKTDYEKNMKKSITHELLDNPARFFADDLTLNKQQALEISNNLEYQNEVLCTPSGDIYRIASIVDSRFSDDSAVNIRQLERSDQSDKNKQSDKLRMGIYCVKGEQHMKFKNTPRLKYEEKELKIMLFLCKKDQDRFLLNRAGFEICGKYLCWSYPQEKNIHILDMTGMKEVQQRKWPMLGLTSALFTGMKSLFASKVSQSQVNEVDDGDDNFQQAPESKIKIQRETDESSEQADDDVFKLNANKDDSFMNVTSHNEIQSQSHNDSALQCKTDYSQMNESQVAFNSTEEDDQDNDQDFQIEWESYDTKTIDLALMCVNQNDEISMKISEVPKSLKFSIINNAEGEEPTLRDNLLQVTVRDKTIIFDISNIDMQDQNDPEETSFIDATKQFINPNSYTDTGARVTLCYEDPSKADDGYLIDSIFVNRRKDICFLRQDRLVANRHIKLEQLPKTPPILGIFKNYTEMDLKELERIQEKITKHAKLDNIDYETLLSNFAGHTAFSIFASEVKFHEQVNTQFTEDDFNEEVQEDEDVFENNILRRIYQVLTLPTPDLEIPIEEKKEEEQNDDQQDFEEKEPEQGDQDYEDSEEEDEKNKKAQKGLKSVLKKSLHDKKNVRIKDCLLFIANKCAECNITTFCENQDDFKELLGNLSQNALELINESFVSTAFTVKCMNSCWESDLTQKTFRQNTSRITEKQVSDRILKDLQDEGFEPKAIGKSQVEVRMLDLSWMLGNGKNFVHFTKTLEDSSSEAIYETEFIDILVEEFWNENYEKILYRCLIPWFSYAFLAQTYFINALAEDHSQGWCTVLGILVLLNLSWQLRIEMKQLTHEENFCDYLLDINNLMDLFQVSTTIWIVISQSCWPNSAIPPIGMQRVLAAMSTLFLWVKVFDWLKLFSTTSFFVKLITETLIDIQHFIMIFFVAIFMFGVPMYILGLNSPADAEAPLIDEVFGSGWFFNSFYNQYMLSLGEFAMDGFGDSPQVILCYVLFLCATFITQITFLNMLVAIMGDSYSKVMEAKDRYGLQTRIDIMVNYTSLILDEDREEDNDTYLFVVTPKAEGDEDAGGEWGGNLTLIKQTIDRGLHTLQKSLDKKLENVAQNLLDSKSRDKRMEKDMRGQYLRIMEKFIAVQEKFESIDMDTTDKIYNIVKRSQEDQKNSSKELKMATDQIHEQQTKLFKNKIQQANKEQKSAIEFKSKISNELSLVKKNQERMIQEAAAGEQGASNEPDENVMAQHDSVSQEIISKLSEQQTSMMSQLEAMKDQTQRIESSISENARNQAALQNELQTSQNLFMKEIQELKNSKVSFEDKIKESVQAMEAENAQQEEATNGGISDDQMASLQTFIQNMASNLTNQQSQMQESISEQQRVDKQQLMDLLAANSAE